MILCHLSFLALRYLFWIKGDKMETTCVMWNQLPTSKHLEGVAILDLSTDMMVRRFLLLQGM